MKANNAKNQLEYDGNNDNRKNNGEVIGERFVFENRPCECKIDIIHNNGIQQYRLQVKASSCDRIFYAYDSRKRGLVTTDSAYREVLDGNDVLTELCNLRLDITKEPEPLAEYFRKYGFFIPISDQNYAIYDFEELLKVLTRLQRMIDLLYELTCDFEKINYNHLFELTFYYILSDENASIVRDNKGSVNLQIQGFLHPYSNIWWKPDFLKIRAKLWPIFANGEDIENLYESYNPSEHYYVIYDSFIGQDVELNRLEWIQYIIDEEPIEPYQNQGRADEIAWEIAFHYLTVSKENIELRKVVDFLYHFNTEVIGINRITPDGRVEFEREIDLNNSQTFNDRYKKLLIEIAKSVYKSELDWGLKRIRPVCNAESFRPKWNISSFLTALYFSLFYFDSEYQEYRICENETCRKWFSVPKSRRNKKYCNPECANLAAQRRFRRKKIK